MWLLTKQVDKTYSFAARTSFGFDSETPGIHDQHIKPSAMSRVSIILPGDCSSYSFSKEKLLFRGYLITKQMVDYSLYKLLQQRNIYYMIIETLHTRAVKYYKTWCCYKI